MDPVPGYIPVPILGCEYVGYRYLQQFADKIA
jgi:hypothetical protein